MAERLAIGVLGAGPIAQLAHFEACRKAANAELYAICDVAPDLLAQAAAEHHPTRTFASYEAMLADPAVDAVIVAVGDAFHVPGGLQALAAGKHVLVEKPLGVTVAECEQLVAAVDASGLTLQLGTMRRFDPALQEAARFVRDQVGAVVALKAWYGDSAYRYAMTDAVQPITRTSADARRPAADPKADPQRYAFLGHGTHLIDLALWLAGEITEVAATTARRGAVTTWFIACTFATGAVGHLDLSMGLQLDWHEGLQLYGEHGSVLARGFQPWYFRAAEVQCFSERDGSYHRPLGADGHFFRRQVEGFARTILDGAPQEGATARDGLHALRVIDAIERSLATGGGREAV